MSDKPEVSFIGLGAMGFGMATHLVKQGYRVTGFDVWAPTLERFAAAGGLTATSPAATVAGKNFCVCMVATAQQAQAVLFEGPDAAVPALPQGATVLLCSTVPCAYVQALEKQLADVGRSDIYLVDAPVSGGVVRASDGTLSIMAGASDAAIEKGRFLLQELADPQKLYIVAGGIGAGSNMKMVHQVLAAVQIPAASEAIGFADHLGLDLPKTYEAVLATAGHSFFFEHRVPRVFTNFQPIASAVNIIVKDTSIITTEARRAGYATVLASAAEQVFFAALARGWGPDDDSSLVRVYNEGKGKLGPLKGAAASEAEKLELVVALLEGIHTCAAAESLAFADRLGLDLDQVLDLCVNAAGASAALKKVGPAIVASLKAKKTSDGAGEGLRDLARRLSLAVEEAGRLKVPIFLASQSLNLLQLALQPGEAGVSSVSVLKSL